MRQPFVPALVLTPLLLTLAAPAQSGLTFRCAREDVLGTRNPFPVTAPDEAPPRRADAAVTAEVERLAAVLSTWDDKAAALAGVVSQATRKAGADSLVWDGTSCPRRPVALALPEEAPPQRPVALVGTIALVAAFAFGVA